MKRIAAVVMLGAMLGLAGPTFGQESGRLTFSVAHHAIRRAWSGFTVRIGTCTRIALLEVACRDRIEVQARVGWQPWQTTWIHGHEYVLLRDHHLRVKHGPASVWVTVLG